MIRFADRESHQIFLEPEGLDDPTVYPNGISTSLPAETQARLIATIPGPRAGADPSRRLCDRIRLCRSARARPDARGAAASRPVPGRPDQRHDRLRGGGGAGPGRRRQRGARQPAARRPRCSTAPSSYLGVMIDDLTTHGVSEPYRMFTSRAEFRLSLRADNADERLTAQGRRARLRRRGAGRAPPRTTGATDRRARAAQGRDARRRRRWSGSASRSIRTARAGRRSSSRPAAIPAGDPGAGVAGTRGDSLDARRAGWRPTQNTQSIVDRQAEDVARHRRDDALLLPEDLDYTALPGLSREMRQKFSAVRPRSLGQAGRIEGVTPAALAVIAAHARRAEREAAPRPRSELGGPWGGVERPRTPSEADRLAVDRREALRLVPVSRETAGPLRDLRRAASPAGVRRPISSPNRPSRPSGRVISPTAPSFFRWPQGATRWLDMGSGAGFPGLIVAIQLAGTSRAPSSIASTATSGVAPSCARPRAPPARRPSSTPSGLNRSPPETSELWTASPRGPSPPCRKTLEFAKPWMERGAVGLFPRGRSASRTSNRTLRRRSMRSRRSAASSTPTPRSSQSG